MDKKVTEYFDFTDVLKHHDDGVNYSFNWLFHDELDIFLESLFDRIYDIKSFGFTNLKDVVNVGEKVDVFLFTEFGVVDIDLKSDKLADDYIPRMCIFFSIQNHAHIKEFEFLSDEDVLRFDNLLRQLRNSDLQLCSTVTISNFFGD